MEKEREIAIRIIDEFENLLAEHDIKLPNEERLGDEFESCIYGTDYFKLEDRITSILYDNYQENKNRYIIMFKYFDRYANEMKKVHINTGNLNDFDDKIKELKDEYFTTIYEVIYISENLFNNSKYKELFELMNIKRIGKPILVPNECFFEIDNIVNTWYQNKSFGSDLINEQIMEIYSMHEKDIINMNPDINISNVIFKNLVMQSIFDKDTDKNFAPPDKIQLKYYEEECEEWN